MEGRWLLKTRQEQQLFAGIAWPWVVGFGLRKIQAWEPNLRVLGFTVLGFRVLGFTVLGLKVRVQGLGCTA